MKPTGGGDHTCCDVPARLKLGHCHTHQRASKEGVVRCVDKRVAVKGSPALLTFLIRWPRSSEQHLHLDVIQLQEVTPKLLHSPHPGTDVMTAFSSRPAVGSHPRKGVNPNHAHRGDDVYMVKYLKNMCII